MALVWTGYQLAIREITTPSPNQIVSEENLDPGITKTPTRKVTPISQEPLDDSSAWINSHPTGAEVYILPATVSLNDLRVEDIQQETNLVGNTPLTLDLSAGNYYILTLFSAELYTNIGYELPVYSSPTYRNALPSDGSLIRSASFSDGEYIKDVSRVYRLYKDAGSATTLISVALPLPESQRNLTMPFIYPTLDTVNALPISYTFTEENVRNAIESNLSEHNLSGSVGKSMVDEILQVLSYVGKVALETDPASIIIQLSGQDQSSFTITVYQ